jgi:WD40 repeat protein
MGEACMDTAIKLLISTAKILLFIPASLLLISCATTPDVRLNSADMTMQLKETAYRVSSLAVSDNGKYVASGDVNGDVTLWDIQKGKMNWKMNGHKRPGGSAMTADNWVWSAAFTPDSRKLLTGGGGDKLLKIWDVDQGKLLQNLAGHEGHWFDISAAIFSIAVYDDGKKALTAGGDHTIRWWNLEKGALIRSSVASDRSWTRGAIQSVDVSAGDKYALSNDAVNSIKLWDNESGSELFTLPLSGEEWWMRSVFAKNGKWAISGGSRLRFWDLSTGTLLRELRESGGCGTHHLSVSKNEKLLLTSGCQFIRLWDIDSGQLLNTYRGDRGMPKSGIFDAAVFHPNNKWIVTKGLDAAMRIKDMATDEEIALLVGFRDGEWLVITSEGYYNASAKGAEYLKVEFEGTDYNVDQFYDVFYRPDIVAAKLSGQDVSGLISLTMKDAIKSPPPILEIMPLKDADSPKIKVCYSAKSTGGGIGEVRLFHNGKLIQSDGYYREVTKSTVEKTQLAALDSKAIYEDMRSVSIKGKVDSLTVSGKSKGDVFQDCKEIDAVPGDNEISVTAFNGSNTVQGYMKTINLNSKANAEAPHLYILAVGIDQYKDTNGNLKYAVKDAKDLEEKLKVQSATLYNPKNIHYLLLTDQEATKSNIVNKVNELANTIKPQDSFILFVAGHGVLLQNQYYMLTHDYNGRVNDNSMISSNEIVEMSKKIKSLNQLFIFDTCHAGGVDTIVSGLYDARMSVLAKKMGLHIYASANDKQAAMDGYKGNGLFTYVLLDGLNNNREADKYKDGKVSVVGLGEYSKKITANISKEIGHSQTPLIINFGKDNAVYKLP